MYDIVRRILSNAVTFLFVSGATLFILPARAADFFNDCNTADNYCSIELYGPIVVGDYDRFQDMIQANTEQGFYTYAISLASPGGDVQEALRIGYAVRKYALVSYAPDLKIYYPELPADPSNYEMKLYAAGIINYFVSTRRLGGRYIKITSNKAAIGKVPNLAYDFNAQCSSACALIYFGGVERSGVVGLHHVYVPEGASYQETDNRLEEARKLLDAYFYDMHVPADAVFAMRTTQSNDISWRREIGEIDENLREFLVQECHLPTRAEEDRAIELGLAKDIGFDVSTGGKVVMRKLTASESEWLLAFNARSPSISKCKAQEIFNIQNKAQHTKL